MTGCWRVCPLQAIAAHVPASGVIVDLGCGHGLFSQLLARESAQCSVIAIDLDAEKIAIARTMDLPNLRFIRGDVAGADMPPTQALTILDVFYLIPYEIQERLLTVCVGRLTPGGVILLNEMAEKPRWKVWLNQLEETLAVRVLKITESLDGRFYFRTRAEWEALFGRLGLTVQAIPVDRGYYHPHIVYVARKAAT
jgi:trans-aconitate methyltransferase